jgi:pimeloyl-ACP methyl ester carboxylesterase
MFILPTLFLSGCLMLNRLVYTDAELQEHYQDKKLKPVYKKAGLAGRKMHYAVMSTNDTLPLLIMIHGAPGAWYGYLNLMDDSLLQTNFKIISVDRLGYGKSGYGKEVLSTQAQALAVKNIIDIENTTGRKVFILGRSYGTPIAAWLAIKYPETFEKLVLVSPVIDPNKEKFYWFSNLGKSKFIQWLLPDFLNVATKEKFSHENEMRLMSNDWKRLYTPTYVLVGEEDQIADTANFSFAKSHIVNCPAVFVKLKHTGHLITFQQPELIKQFLMDKSNCRNTCKIDSSLCGEFCEQVPLEKIKDDLRAETRVDLDENDLDYPQFLYKAEKN